MASTIDGAKELRRAARELGKAEKLITKTARRAVNGTVRHARTFANREIRKRVRLKAGYINKHLHAVRARGNSLTAVLRAEERPVLLSHYSMKPLTRKAKSPAHKLKGNPAFGIPAGRKLVGVSVNVKRNTGRKKMPGAFLVKLRNSGATGIAYRGDGGKLDVKHSMSVDQVFRLGVRKKTRRESRIYLRKEMDRLLGVEMKKLWPKR